MADDDDDQLTARRARKARSPEHQSNDGAARRRRPPPAAAAVPAPRSPRRPSDGHGASAAADLSRKKPEEEETVGYGRPPKHSQFKPGQSGNPRGRPKQSRSLRTYLRKALDEIVEVNEQGRPRKMTKREVIARQTVNQAMKGNLKSLAVITDYDPVEEELPRQEEPLTEQEWELLAELLGTSKEAKA